MLRALLKNDAGNVQCSLLMHSAIKLLCYHKENEAKLIKTKQNDAVKRSGLILAPILFCPPFLQHPPNSLLCNVTDKKTKLRLLIDVYL